MKLSKAQKAAYIKSPYHCPYCNSAQIEVGNLEVSVKNHKKIFQHVVCLKCNETWKDVFVLAKVK